MTDTNAGTGPLTANAGVTPEILVRPATVPCTSSVSAPPGNAPGIVDVKRTVALPLIGRKLNPNTSKGVSRFARTVS